MKATVSNRLLFLLSITIFRDDVIYLDFQVVHFSVPLWYQTIKIKNKKKNKTSL